MTRALQNIVGMQLLASVIPLRLPTVAATQSCREITALTGFYLDESPYLSGICSRMDFCLRIAINEWFVTVNHLRITFRIVL